MISKEMYRIIVTEMIKHKSNLCGGYNEDFLNSNDFVVMMYLIGILDCENFKEIKSSRIADIIEMKKSDVKDSIDRLTKLKILIESKEEFNFGFKIGTSFNDINE